MGQNRAFFPHCGINIAFKILCYTLQSLCYLVQVGRKEGNILPQIFALFCTGWEEGRKYSMNPRLCIILYRLEGRKEGVKNDVKRKSLF